MENGSGSASNTPSRASKRKPSPSVKVREAMADGQSVGGIQESAVYGEIVQNLVGLHEFQSRAGGVKNDEEYAGMRGGIKDPVTRPAALRSTSTDRDTADGEMKGTRKSNGRSGKKNIAAEVVVVLKEWYDTHTDWPYPTQAEKEEFAKKTGVPEDTVNNWFINARKRNRDPKDKNYSAKRQNKGDKGGRAGQAKLPGAGAQSAAQALSSSAVPQVLVEPGAGAAPSTDKAAGAAKSRGTKTVLR